MYPLRGREIATCLFRHRGNCTNRHFVRESGIRPKSKQLIFQARLVECGNQLGMRRCIVCMQNLTRVAKQSQAKKGDDFPLSTAVLQSCTHTCSYTTKWNKRTSSRSSSAHEEGRWSAPQRSDERTSTGSNARKDRCAKNNLASGRRERSTIERLLSRMSFFYEGGVCFSIDEFRMKPTS